MLCACMHASRQSGSQAARQPGSQAARQPGSQASIQAASQVNRDRCSSARRFECLGHFLHGRVALVPGYKDLLSLNVQRGQGIS